MDLRSLLGVGGFEEGMVMVCRAASKSLPDDLRGGRDCWERDDNIGGVMR
jgi:hypothetical protein